LLPIPVSGFVFLIVPHPITFSPPVGFVAVPEMQAHGKKKKYTKNDPEQPASPEEPDNGNQYNIFGYPEPGRLRMF
jgi:hypothetical protein